jgi:hypothetical protein
LSIPRKVPRRVLAGVFIGAIVFGHCRGQRVCSGQRTEKVALNSELRPLCRDLKRPRLVIIDREGASDRRRRTCYPLRLAGPSLSLGCFLLLSFLLLLAIDNSFDISIHFAPKACQPTFDTFDIPFVIFGINDVAQIFLPDWFERLLPRLRLTQLNAAFFGVL